LGKPELVVEIDRDKARRFGMSTGQIGTAIRTALFGKEVSRYKEGKDDYPINVRFQDEFRYDGENLLNQSMTFRDMVTGQMRQVPVSAVATPVKTNTFSAVKRKNNERVITIASNVKEGFNPNETVASIKKAMQNYALPAGYKLKFTGEQEEQEKEMGFLSNALMIAVFLIFLIIVAQFNSAGTPFIIVASVIFSLIGVLLGLVIFQMDFIIIMTMIGIISLAGVVVNNAIVLIDYANLLMDRRKAELGIPLEKMLSLEEIRSCIIEAGNKRLRPVLLTAITTVLGLLPLALGMNINFFTMLSDFNPKIYFGGDNAIFWGPMSWTVIFGLTFATFLTLIIVPVMYYLLNRVKLKFAKQ
jgi:multidrug efflux pump